MFNPEDHQHIRYNPLKGDWVLVSPHRMKRPWSGQVETIADDIIPDHDPNNPLCPRVTRPNGQTNPDYRGTYVFDNDFPAMLEHSPDPEYVESPLFQIEKAEGKCKVICFHPKTSVTLPTMTAAEIKDVVERWISETNDLGKKYVWVQIFENKGAIMGCSNPHPHCQIWASSFLPNEPRIKDKFQKDYYVKYGQPLLLDYVQQELQKKIRIVVENEDWVVVVPFWATWPFETMLLPKVHIKRITELNERQKETLSVIIKQLTIKYDNLFQTSFPYSMGWHGAPTGSLMSEDDSHWVLHGVYYPPLLRSATIKKFMVGYEMLAQCQRDFTPEQAANKLANLSAVHYKNVISDEKQ